MSLSLMSPQEFERVNKLYRKSFTPMHVAIERGDVEKVKSLVITNPEFIDSKTNRGETPMRMAIEKGDKAIVEFLLNVRPNLIDTVGNRSESILHIAAEYGRYEIVKLLLDYKPELINSTDDFYNTPLSAAVTIPLPWKLTGHIKTIELLLETNSESAYVLNDRKLSPLEKVVFQLDHRSGASDIIKVFEGKAPLDHVLDEFISRGKLSFEPKYQGNLLERANQLLEKCTHHLIKHLRSDFAREVIEYIVDSKTIDLGTVTQFQYSLPNQPTLLGSIPNLPDKTQLAITEILTHEETIEDGWFIVCHVGNSNQENVDSACALM